jgi:hypothetical protein
MGTVAQAAFFLAFDDARFITGSSWPAARP